MSMILFNSIQVSNLSKLLTVWGSASEIVTLPSAVSCIGWENIAANTSDLKERDRLSGESKMVLACLMQWSEESMGVKTQTQWWLFQTMVGSTVLWGWSTIGSSLYRVILYAKDAGMRNKQQPVSKWLLRECKRDCSLTLSGKNEQNNLNWGHTLL